MGGATTFSRSDESIHCCVLVLLVPNYCKHRSKFKWSDFRCEKTFGTLLLWIHWSKCPLLYQTISFATKLVLFIADKLVCASSILREHYQGQETICDLHDHILSASPSSYFSVSLHLSPVEVLAGIAKRKGPWGPGLRRG